MLIYFINSHRVLSSIEIHSAHVCHIFSLVRYCVSVGSVVQKLRQKPRCDFECCLLVTLMLHGASAYFSGLDRGEAFSRQVIQDETFQLPGLEYSLDEIGAMDVEMQEREENKTGTCIKLYTDED